MAAQVLQFKNYIEGWEAERISLKNDKCRSSLLEKYTHIYIFYEGEVRRVTDVVWSTTSRPARNQAVTAFAEMLDADNGCDHENVNYQLYHQRCAPSLHERS